MLNLLHISDLHFGNPFLPDIGEALLHKISGLSPDILVISGDITQRARPEEFKAARAYFDRMPPIPQLVVPGNHDIPLYRIFERLFQPYKLYHRYIDKERNIVLRQNNAVIVGLDSTNPYFAITNGRIRREQLDFCAEAFAMAPPEAARIVVAHHHFAPAPDYKGGEIMPKAKRALDFFTGLKVDLILAGHLHRAYIGNSLDVYPGEDREHGIIIAQCGTSTSRRGRVREQEKNSFNRIEIMKDSIRIFHYMYFTDYGDFYPTARHEFVRQSQRNYLVESPLDKNNEEMLDTSSEKI
ncbi:metallophosphoesterase family protein [Nitrosococcus oceani]|uniref:Metallophosphoesterase n=2 Tax=Nitrosococcus oceani TaxID=1229 RepID=Q3JBN5_NITOC|nr:metallophosphoesterase family protein [Nitrosococcus oceani]KFI19849.1 3',5'-cyclic-nucleotide phosphodiesterase [Nitrosococcus oceani C-27]ABA57761.1 Metallophosphoesterase [Nitrosococcus oceani ATCC 19707]EDZ67690.1 Ser/Thr protein phosphatase family protein [Nitrosococcus oceani AFC27]KFI22989.1 3',5'-cyclic-nucleotide phosphodiesterase [Nitrosococcus oceani]GEM19415.1 3',5'-cyclic-nucleotide phosphodiesterase [Nitrosococcus oceani]